MFEIIKKKENKEKEKETRNLNHSFSTMVGPVIPRTNKVMDVRETKIQKKDIALEEIKRTRKERSFRIRVLTLYRGLNDA